MAMNIEFSKEIQQLIEEVSKLNNMTVTEFIQEAVLEKVEDYYALQVGQQAYQEWVSNGKQTYTHEEMMKRYG